jgi:hypothetical protein
MTREQFEDFKKRVWAKQDDFLRFGQFAFNILFKEYPEIANLVCETEYDPFYEDKKLNKFFDYIETFVE